MTGDYTHSLLRTLVDNIDNPEDLFKGSNYSLIDMPENVVVFKRNSVSELLQDTISLHYRYNLIINLEGTCAISVDEYLLTLHPGQALVIHPFQNHHYHPLHEQAISWLYIGFDFPSSGILEVLRNKVVNYRADWRGMLEFLLSRQNLCVLYSDSQLCLITVLLLTDMLNNMRTVISSQTDELRDRNLRIFREVQKWLYYNLDKKVSTGEIAGKLGLSESHLRSLFKKQIGISLGYYIRKTKINYACSLLAHREYNITEIAFKCGYDSLYAFSRSFKTITGMSPRNYLKGRQASS